MEPWQVETWSKTCGPLVVLILTHTHLTRCKTLTSCPEAVSFGLGWIAVPELDHPMLQHPEAILKRPHGSGYLYLLGSSESQSKPGIKMVHPEPCEELQQRRPQLFLVGIVHYKPSLTRVLIMVPVKNRKDTHDDFLGSPYFHTCPHVVIWKKHGPSPLPPQQVADFRSTDMRLAPSGLEGPFWWALPSRPQSTSRLPINIRPMKSESERPKLPRIPQHFRWV